MINTAVSCIQGYATRNKAPPKTIVVFMLTVPEPQVNLIQENFALPLEKYVSDSYKTDINIVVIMINLKNSERFFTVGNEIRNVFPGTIVTSDVVSKKYDFYIVSQQSRGSTVPNHYRVIYSNSKFEEGHLQEIIFSQCFSYCNWTGSIKVPSVLQYAKKCSKFQA